MGKISFRPQLVAAAMLSAVLAGSFPVTAFANTGKEADCICETRCGEESVNEECPVCRNDIALCQGTEPEKTEESTESAPEPEEPLTPDGNMNLVDDYGDHEASGKQFITLTTKDGNYFYLIIDRDDSGKETVHFLNQVDESDLLSLMDKEEVKEYTARQDDESTEDKLKEEKAAKESSSAEPAQPAQASEETKSKEKKTPSVPVGTLVLLVLTGFAAIGAYVYKKIGKKNKKDDRPDPDADYQEGEEEDYLKELEDDGNLEEDGEGPENNSDG